MAKVTVRDAARLVGKNRATLYRYIGEGALSVTVETHGKQRVRVVDTAELERVFGPLGDQGRQPATGAVRPAENATATVAWQAELDSLRRENDLLRRQLDETRSDKERLFRLLEDQRARTEHSEPERRRWPGLRAWWRRLIEGED